MWGKFATLFTVEFCQALNVYFLLVTICNLQVIGWASSNSANTTHECMVSSARTRTIVTFSNQVSWVLDSECEGEIQEWHFNSENISVWLVTTTVVLLVFYVFFDSFVCGKWRRILRTLCDSASRMENFGRIRSFPLCRVPCFTTNQLRPLLNGRGLW